MEFWRDPAYAAFWLDVARGDLATWIQLTPYVYAALEGVHLVGVAFFFGAILLLDLRVLGFMRELPMRPVADLSLRVCAGAFALLAVSGVLMFIPSADRYAASATFLLKIGVTAVGGLNALIFHLEASRKDVWSHRARGPRAACAAAAVSLLVWTGVITLGRAMGYERREPPEVDFELEWFDATVERREGETRLAIVEGLARDGSHAA